MYIDHRLENGPNKAWQTKNWVLEEQSGSLEPDCPIGNWTIWQEVQSGSSLAFASLAACPIVPDCRSCPIARLGQLPDNVSIALAIRLGPIAPAARLGPITAARLL